MNIIPDLPFQNVHNPFTNGKISVPLDKHSRMSFDIKDYFDKQCSHLSKGVLIVALALCQLNMSFSSLIRSYQGGQLT